MSRGRVFVTGGNENKLDLSLAEVYGELVRLQGKQGRHANMQDLLATYAAIRAMLQTATIQDWLLPLGSPAVIALAGAEFLRKTGMIRVLLWDNYRSDYVPNEAVLPIFAAPEEEVSHG